MTALGVVISIILFVSLVCFFILITKYWTTDTTLYMRLCLIPIHIILSAVLTICLIAIFVLPISYSDYVPDSQSSKKVEIYSLDSNNEGKTQGHFVLGCGTIFETCPTYCFHIVTQDSVYELKEVNANKFNIVYTDTIEPCIVYDATRMVMYPTNKFFFNECKYYDIEYHSLTGTIYIPKNSVVQSYGNGCDSQTINNTKQLHYETPMRDKILHLKLLHRI